VLATASRGLILWAMLCPYSDPAERDLFRGLVEREQPGVQQVQVAVEAIPLPSFLRCVWASAPVLAVKRTTTTIPVVFAAQMDPVGARVVESLARPGGNITGMSIQQTDTAGKRIELLREVNATACNACSDSECWCAGRDARDARKLSQRRVALGSRRRQSR
jgi:hypothetical protein